MFSMHGVVAVVLCEWQRSVLLSLSLSVSLSLLSFSLSLSLSLLQKYSQCCSLFLFLALYRSVWA